MDVYDGSRPGTFTTVSRILLRPEAHEDGTRLRCEARHPAMADDQQHLRDEVTITVLCKYESRKYPRICRAHMHPLALTECALRSEYAYARMWPDQCCQDLTLVSILRS